MDRRIVYFINPISGGKQKEHLLTIIEKATEQKGIAFEILPTNKEGDYFFLKEKIANEQVTDIVICGGDGTISQICSYLIDEPVQVGIIPLGSGNGLALAAKIPTQIEAALAIVFNNSATFIDSFFINSTFSCMLCGLGLDAKVAHDFAEQPGRGLKNYIKHTFNNFFTAQPYSFDIVNKGEQINVHAFFISIANSNQFGNSLTIAPKATLNDGLLDVVIVKKENKFSLFFKLINQLKAGKLATVSDVGRTFHYFQTKKITIYNPEKELIHIDGEPMQAMEIIEIEIIKNAFKLIQP